MEILILGDTSHMDIAVGIILGHFVFLTTALIIGLFIWAALKDGQEDGALQAWLGIRRRTRLGRLGRPSSDVRTCGD